MFAREDSLWAVPFDENAQKLEGDPFLVQEDVAKNAAKALMAPWAMGPPLSSASVGSRPHSTDRAGDISDRLYRAHPDASLCGSGRRDRLPWRLARAQRGHVQPHSLRAGALGLRHAHGRAFGLRETPGQRVRLSGDLDGGRGPIYHRADRRLRPSGRARRAQASVAPDSADEVERLLPLQDPLHLAVRIHRRVFFERHAHHLVIPFGNRRLRVELDRVPHISK